MLFGHIAVSALLYRYLKVELKPVIVGGIFPDLVDKTLCQILRLTPSGRMFAHTLLGWGLSTVGVGLLRGPRAAWSWSLGYLGHLVADSSGFVPWFYPFASYEFKPSSAHLFTTLRNMLLKPKWLELTLLLWAAWIFKRGGAQANSRK